MGRADVNVKEPLRQNVFHEQCLTRTTLINVDLKEQNYHSFTATLDRWNQRYY